MSEKLSREKEISDTRIRFLLGSIEEWYDPALFTSQEWERTTDEFFRLIHAIVEESYTHSQQSISEEKFNQLQQAAEQTLASLKKIKEAKLQTKSY